MSKRKRRTEGWDEEVDEMARTEIKLTGQTVLQVSQSRIFSLLKFQWDELPSRRSDQPAGSLLGLPQAKSGPSRGQSCV